MSRDLDDDKYYITSGGKIPVKWTAPEVSTGDIACICVTLAIHRPSSTRSTLLSVMFGVLVVYFMKCGA